MVWGPVQDGGYFYGQIKQESFLPETPPDLRRQGLFAKIPIIVGINAQDGAKKASECQRNDDFIPMKGEGARVAGEILSSPLILLLKRMYGFVKISTASHVYEIVIAYQIPLYIH